MQERQQSDGLERHRFAAGVGTGENEHVGAAELEIERHRGALLAAQLGFQKRMPRAAQDETLAGARRRRRELAPPKRPRLHRVDRFDRVETGFDGGGVGGDPAGQFFEDAADLAALGIAPALQLVVRIQHFERFDEERRAASRTIVDDAADTAGRVGTHRDHVAVAALRHVLVGRGAGAAHQALEPRQQIFALFLDLAPQAAQERRRVVAQFATFVDDGANRHDERRVIPQPGGTLANPWPALRLRCQSRAQARGSFERRGDAPERRRLEARSRQPRFLQQLAAVVGRIDGPRPGAVFERAARFGNDRLLGAHERRIGARHKRFDAHPATGRARRGCDAGENLVVFENAPGMTVGIEVTIRQAIRETQRDDFATRLSVRKGSWSGASCA
jgi:hypothetical protein